MGSTPRPYALTGMRGGSRPQTPSMASEDGAPRSVSDRGGGTGGSSTNNQENEQSEGIKALERGLEAQGRGLISKISPLPFLSSSSAQLDLLPLCCVPLITTTQVIFPPLKSLGTLQLGLSAEYDPNEGKHPREVAAEKARVKEREDAEARGRAVPTPVPLFSFRLGGGSGGFRLYSPPVHLFSLRAP